MDTDNYEKKLFDMHTRLNNLKKCKNNSKELNIKKEALHIELNDTLFSYDPHKILNLMNISVETKLEIGCSINIIKMYHIKKDTDRLIVIKYVRFGSNYCFKLNDKFFNLNPKVRVYKNDKYVKTYNIATEFSLIDFNKLSTKKYLDNFIDLIIKDDVELKFGMLIMCYYYLIYYYRYKLSEVSSKLIMEKSNIIKFKKLFDMDISHLIFDNY